MKKVILFLALVLAIGGVSFNSMKAMPAYASSSRQRELPDDVVSITVYKVVQVGGNAWSTTRYNALYSPSENCIYITEGRRENQPYSVTENRAYGQDNDGRSEYQYRAGDYYFNL